MVELFEAKGIKVGLIEGVSGFDACTFLLDNGTPIIAVKRNLPGDRQRFSLAHELGHIVLNPSTDLDSEKAFNRFAGAFLVPEPTVKYELGIKRKELNLYELHILKHRYGLSMQGWIHRAEDLGVISESVARQMRKVFSTHGWKTSEPGDQLASESPWRMDILILRALGEGIISESRAAELLGKPLGDFLGEVKEKHKGLPISASI
jgi:Zn-dependent peptidase ImmA (M78 family)